MMPTALGNSAFLSMANLCNENRHRSRRGRNLGKDFLTLRPQPKLNASYQVLRGPDGHKLPVQGAFTTSWSVSLPCDKSSQHTVYVVRNLLMSLLGRHVIQLLNILHHLEVSKVSSSICKSDIASSFPTLFSGLGELTGPQH